MATTNTVTSGQQTIPTELMPFFTGVGTAGSPGYSAGLLPTAQTLFSKDYATGYGTDFINSGLSGAGRVAGLVPNQKQVGTELQGMTTPGQFQTGYGSTQLGLGALGSMLSPEMTQMYMSPYMQNVLDVNKQEAMRDAQKGLVGQNMAAAKQGSYGGARNALMMSEADRNLQTKLGQIQAQGMQGAFDAAQKAQLGSATAYSQLGDVLTRAGTAKAATDIDRLKTLGAYGDLERAYNQQGIDARYQDFLKQMGYKQEQLGNMSDILRGVPIVRTGETSSVTTPPPSFASSLAGMGLSGLSLFNMLK
jgi:hypothetical protein